MQAAAAEAATIKNDTEPDDRRAKPPLETQRLRGKLLGHSIPELGDLAWLHHRYEEDHLPPRIRAVLERLKLRLPKLDHDLLALTHPRETVIRQFR